MKKQIVEESALNVGYYESVIPEIIEKIDPDTFFKLMGMDSGEWLLKAAKSKDRAQFQNILVSEAVKHMSYSEFKTIANFFFNYKEIDQEIIADPLELSEPLFQKIQQQSEQIFAPDKNEHQETDEVIFKDRIFESINLQNIEFTTEYIGDENNMGRVPKQSLELQIASIEPNSWLTDDKYFVRAALVDRQDDVLDEVILTPFIVEIPEYTEEKWLNWFDSHADDIENIIFSNADVKTLLEELDFRKLPEVDRQAILDLKNGVINLFNDFEEESIDTSGPDFEDTKERVLDELEKAQSEFRKSMVTRTPEAIFDQASKILYVTDSLLEVEELIEEFTEEDYEERSYSYDKQLSALFDRYSSNPPENGSQSFIAAAEDAWADSPTNYETGTDDKSDFMERYVANYFELSPYLKAQESKVTEPAKVSPTITKSPTL